MRTSAVVFALVASVMAFPAYLVERQNPFICTGTTNTPLCCDVDVLGVADLDCSTPPSTPQNTTDFTAICADIGKIDRCCLLPLAGQALVCAAPA